MNALGTAPGMWLERDQKTFISLPGVPYEMQALVSEQVIPKLKVKYHRPFILHKTLLVYGLGESTLANRIVSWEDALPGHIKLAYLPNLGKMRLRLSAPPGTNTSAALKTSPLNRSTPSAFYACSSGSARWRPIFSGSRSASACCGSWAKDP